MRRACAALLVFGSLLASAQSAAGAEGTQHAIADPIATSVPVKGIAVTLGYANLVTDARAMVIAGELFPMLRRTLHANAVSLNFPFWQNGSTSSAPGRAAMTPSPERMIAITQLAQRSGLSVQWRPYLFEGNLRARSHNWIRPSSPTRWMANYWSFLRPYLIAATLAGATSFSIGCEQTTLLPYLSQWTVLVRRARALYPGILLYSQQHQPQISIPLTAHGYDAYEAIKLASPSQVSTAAFTTGFERNLQLPAMQSTPADLTLEEVGITATRHAYLAPSNDTFGPHVHVDRRVQTDWFEGACNAFWQLHLAGIYYFAISFDRYRSEENDATSVGGWLGTSSARAIASCFARDGPSPQQGGSSIWTSASNVEESGGDPTSLACATATLCFAVDQSGDVLTDESGTWSEPTHLDGAALTAVSCASISLCIAVDDAGGALRFDGSVWTAMPGVDTAPLTTISCATGTSTCVAADASGRTIRFSAGAWGSPTPIAASPVESISCPTAAGCVAVDASGTVLQDSTGTWRREMQLGSSTLTSVSCATLASCVTGNDDGTLYRISGDASQKLRSGVPGGLVAVSCAVATSCELLGHDGAYALDGTARSAASRPFPGDEPSAVDCLPGGPCVAASYGGEIAVDSGSWSTPVLVDPSPSAFSSVSCGSSSFCVAVDSAGEATSFGGAGWSRLASTGLASASAISCSGHFCIASGDVGHVTSYVDGAWERPQDVDPSSALTAVSCASTTYCLAVDASNRVLTFDGRTWSRPSSEGDPPRQLRGYTAVSCGSTTSCVAVDTHGYALLLDQGHARWVQADDPYVSLTSVSCASSSFCVAVDERGRAVVYSGLRGGWTSPIEIDPHGLAAISCATSSYCLAIDDTGGTLAYRNGTWDAISKGDPLGDPLAAVSCATTQSCAAVSATDAVVLAQP